MPYLIRLVILRVNFHLGTYRDDTSKRIIVSEHFLVMSSRTWGASKCKAASRKNAFGLFILNGNLLPKHQTLDVYGNIWVNK